MGLTGMLGRTIFSKSRSFGAAGHEHHNTSVKRWSSVRSYLCGDELFDSVVAEEDSASVKTFVSAISSEATVTQPMLNELANGEEIAVDDLVSPRQEEDQCPDMSLKDLQDEEEQAAIRIQSAFRCFMVRRRVTRVNMFSDAEEDGDLSKESPGRESLSVCTSLEVQTANSVKIFPVPQKPKTHPMKFKDDWDDSTVSSNIAKMRMQNRLEAMTRRERALAYAFSQQLRICSKKKGGKSEDEAFKYNNNAGWSWLERWMATRIPDKYEHLTTKAQELVISSSQINSLEIAGEEKESCGSNEVFSSNFSSKIPLYSPHDLKSGKTNKNKLKAKRGVSKRKTVPNFINNAPESNPR